MSLMVENLHAQTFLQSSQYRGFLFDPPGGKNYGCECHPQYNVASHSRFSGSFPYKRNSYLSGKIKTRVCRVFTDTLIFYLSMLFSRFSLFCFYMLLETVLCSLLSETAVNVCYSHSLLKSALLWLISIMSEPLSDSSNCHGHYE